MAADWLAIRTDYITSGISYRALSKKYGIPFYEISRMGKAENWVAERERYKDNVQTKTLEKISRQEAERAAKLFSVADKLLVRIERMVDNEEEPLNEKAIRALTAAVRDLREIQGIKSRSDQDEQDARIDNLRRQAQKEDMGKEPIRIELGDGLMEYSG